MASFYTQNLITLLRQSQSLRRNASLPIAPKSMLFVETTRLGNVVTMLPAMQSFKDAFPGADISVAVEEQYAKLFNFLPWVKKVYASPKFGDHERVARSQSNIAPRTVRSVLLDEPGDQECLVNARHFVAVQNWISLSRRNR